MFIESIIDKQIQAQKTILKKQLYKLEKINPLISQLNKWLRIDELVNLEGFEKSKYRHGLIILNASLLEYERFYQIIKSLFINHQSKYDLLNSKIHDLFIKPFIEGIYITEDDLEDIYYEGKQIIRDEIIKIIAKANKSKKDLTSLIKGIELYHQVLDIKQLDQFLDMKEIGDVHFNLSLTYFDISDYFRLPNEHIKSCQPTSALTNIEKAIESMHKAKNYYDTLVGQQIGQFTEIQIELTNELIKRPAIIPGSLKIKVLNHFYNEHGNNNSGDHYSVNSIEIKK
ncbi:MAG: hypothetical protein EP298_10990 [Gammaproteobacteria bacterium]|nr:MAG: hypothetical protein EP298_10990 [Gammaproteobacteria bacterium]UTW41598.1 hypothetical protein KFE69_08770 [bacterium SCSIO 12844]